MTLNEQKNAILLLMDFAVDEDDQAPARELLEKYAADTIALHLFQEFYSYLPEAENDAIRILRRLDKRGGNFLIAATTTKDTYLYLTNSEGAEFLGNHQDGIWDEEVLEYFGYSREESLRKFLDLNAFPVYVPVNLDKSLCLVCAVDHGELHRLGCPLEVCPWCGGQLTRCNCRFSEAGVDQLTSDGQLEKFIEAVEGKGRVPFDATDQCVGFKTP
ncbi:MAG: hypothetical protein PHI06_02210 [Desulfobulbaceae bacterium]|nr:hypothetical protein [Desulfobulbaceae bacterium]